MTVPREAAFSQSDEAIRDRQRLKARRAYLRAPGTPGDHEPFEVYRRRRGNPIERLVEGKRLNELDRRAAYEIQAASNLEMSGYAAQAADYTAPRVDISRRSTYDLPRSIDQAAGLKRFLTWCRGCRRAQWPLGAILAVVCDGDPIRETERLWRLRSGSLTDAIVVALARYVDLAGWR